MGGPPPSGGHAGGHAVSDDVVVGQQVEIFRWGHAVSVKKLTKIEIHTCGEIHKYKNILPDMFLSLNNFIQSYL